MFHQQIIHVVLVAILTYQASLGNDMLLQFLVAHGSSESAHNCFTALLLGLPGWASARRNLLEFMMLEKMTETHTPPIRLGATPTGLISDPHPSSPLPNFYAGCPSCCNHSSFSWFGTGTKYAGLHTQWRGVMGADPTKTSIYYADDHSGMNGNCFTGFIDAVRWACPRPIGIWLCFTAVLYLCVVCMCFRASFVLYVKQYCEYTTVCLHSLTGIYLLGPVPNVAVKKSWKRAVNHFWDVYPVLLEVNCFILSYSYFSEYFLWNFLIELLLFNFISSSVIAEGPRDALSQLKSCQLLHNCTKNRIWLEGLSFHVV